MIAALASFCPLGPLRPLCAQDTALTNSQDRLAQIRRERQRLESEMERLRGRVHSLSSELTNIERQLQMSSSIISELDIQVEAMDREIDRTTRDVLIAEDALAEKRSILQHRLAEIGKRGPLWVVQVLLAAESFGDLISRYKYLYLITRQDRQLVRDVQELLADVRRQRENLLTTRSTRERRRDELTEETERLQRLERQRQQSLQDSRRQQRVTQDRLRELARDESRLTGIIRDLERRRRAAEAAARTAPATPRLRTSDIGRLNWPVEGDIVYSFGRAPGPDETAIRWNGIGIAVPVGTPVRAIAGGTVRVAQTMGTYGFTVIIDHGGGYYSLYGQLQSAAVRVDQAIEAGALVGSTGGANSDEGPHLHFEIRGENGQALDPVQWLRRRL